MLEYYETATYYNDLTIFTITAFYRIELRNFFSYFLDRQLDKEFNEITINSAPSSMGKEPLSLASFLKEHQKQRKKKLSFKIRAFDMNPLLIDFARNKDSYPLTILDFNNIKQFYFLFPFYSNAIKELFNKEFEEVYKELYEKLEINNKDYAYLSVNKELKNYIDFEIKDLIKNPLPKAKITLSFNFLMYLEENFSYFSKAFENLLYSLDKNSYLFTFRNDLTDNIDNLKRLNIDLTKAFTKPTEIKFNNEHYLLESYKYLYVFKKI